MAKAQRSTSAQTGTVASCAATDCKYNDDRSCEAPSVEVKVKDGRAICGTYAPEKPKARP